MRLLVVHNKCTSELGQCWRVQCLWCCTPQMMLLKNKTKKTKVDDYIKKANILRCCSKIILKWHLATRLLLEIYNRSLSPLRLRKTQIILLFSISCILYLKYYFKQIPHLLFNHDIYYFYISVVIALPILLYLLVPFSQSCVVGRIFFAADSSLISSRCRLFNIKISLTAPGNLFYRPVSIFLDNCFFCSYLNSCSLWCSVLRIQLSVCSHPRLGFQSRTLWPNVCKF